MEAGLAKTKVGLSSMAEGATRFCLGLAKKVLIADMIAQNVDRIFALQPTSLPIGLAWLGAIAYTLQIYYDFSGYTDMAIGLSWMFGFACPENFAHPYWSTSIREFWRRWHMTLSSWLRDFVYIPLGGNRGGDVRTYINLVVVFLVCGFWHGAGWAFAIWGLYHGCAIVAERTGALRWLTERSRLLGHGYAILVVIVGWVIFRSHSIGHAAQYIGAMFGASTPVRGILPSAWLMDSEFIVALLVGAALCVPWAEVARGWGSRLTNRLPFGLRLEAKYWRPVAAGIARLVLLLLLVASILQIAAGTYSPFIYSRF
jgi:alginate O-acetyltransferase complex protein AlgI